MVKIKVGKVFKILKILCPCLSLATTFLLLVILDTHIFRRVFVSLNPKQGPNYKVLLIPYNLILQHDKKVLDKRIVPYAFPYSLVF